MNVSIPETTETGNKNALVSEQQATTQAQPNVQTGNQSAVPQTRTFANPCWQRAQQHHAPDPNQVDLNTIKGWNHTLSLLGYLETKGAMFLREANGLLYLKIDKKTIQLDKIDEVATIEDMHNLED